MSTTALPHPAPTGSGGWLRSRGRSLVRGRAEDPAWVRPALIALLTGTAIAYFVNLTGSGYANQFYAGAVQAATKSWKAFFFGSLDASNFITVDKPPASLWVMALSGRLFGFSSLSMLAPQALEGVLSVGLLYAAVRRWFGAGAGLLAGLLLAVTPVATLMFRFNNPDALLVCLLVAAGYCLVRAVENGSTRWVLATGALVGLAFLTKMMQAFLVLPAFGLVYLVAAPTTLRIRIRQLVLGAASIAVSAGWWVAIVALWPAGSRPTIDGSPDNSILNLITGYNGLSRIFGGGGPGGGGPPGGGPGPNFSGSTSLLRLFNELMGGQASWLLPVALLTLAGGLWLTRRRPRTDRARAGLMLWGGWLMVSGLVFSLSSGVIHTYYTVALAPAVAALAAIGTVAVWRHRDRAAARLALAAAILLTAGWSWILLDRTPDWAPWLRAVVVAAAVLAAGYLLVPRRWLRPVFRPAFVALAAVACLAGPVGYSVDTIASAQGGSIASAGPSNAQATGMPGGRPGAVPGGRSGSSTAVNAALAAALERAAGHYRWAAATAGSQPAAALELASSGAPVMAIGGFNNQGGNLTLAQFQKYVTRGEIRYYVASSGGAGAGAAPRAGASPAAGGLGPPPGAGAFPGPPPGGPPLGGTGAGLGPAGMPGAAPPGGPASRAATQSITTWVEAHFKSTIIGGQAVYDLTQPKAG